MSWLSNIGHAITKGATDVGHFAGKVLSNPVVQGASAFIPGVGPLITAGEGALGGLLKPGGNLGSAASGALQGGLAGAAGGSIRKLGTGLLSGGIGGAIHGFGGGSLGGMVGRTSTMGADQVGGGSWTDHIIDFDEGGNPIYDTDLDAGSIMGGGGGSAVVASGAACGSSARGS
jgi:hypothetical protein